MNIPQSIIERLHGIAHIHKLPELHSIADQLQSLSVVEISYQASEDGVNWVNIGKNPPAATSFRYIRPKIAEQQTVCSPVISCVSARLIPPIIPDALGKPKKKKAKKGNKK